MIALVAFDDDSHSYLVFPRRKAGDRGVLYADAFVEPVVLRWQEQLHRLKSSTRGIHRTTHAREVDVDTRRGYTEEKRKRKMYELLSVVLFSALFSSGLKERAKVKAL